MICLVAKFALATGNIMWVSLFDLCCTSTLQNKIFFPKILVENLEIVHCILKMFCWSWGQKTHLAEGGGDAALIQISLQPEVVQTCYSPHMACLSVYYKHDMRWTERGAVC